MHEHPLFTSTADALLRVGLGALALVLVGLPVLLLAWVRSPLVTGEGVPVDQPVPFDHRHHVRDDRIPCGYCHPYAERSTYAGFPETEVCMGCHAQILPHSSALAPVRQSAVENRPIPWVRVHDLPDFVFFDHSAHLAAGVGCEACHGDVASMSRVRPVQPLTMGWCVSCHADPATVLGPGFEDLDPPLTCTGCHR